MIETTSAHVRDALAQVYDPCSVGVGTPLNIVDMGLVRSCTVDDAGVAHIVIGTTTPVCMMIANLVAAIEDAMAATPEVRGVEVEIDPDAVWTPELMSEPARVRLDAGRRDLLRNRPDLVPRRWEKVAGGTTGPGAT